ncbi:MAG: hypothetical protein HY567_01710 [Candidatus Kerfeldbacteria bacterium]|nr:hypothetical protein [Candidatus Kerfeldbacteria bacterium]
MRTKLLGGFAALVLLLSLAARAQAVGPITSFSINPAEALVAAGQTQTFTTPGRDASGATTDLTSNTVFSTTDPSGKLQANVYTGGRAGSWVVTATYAGLTADAQVTVIPGSIADLTVNPNSNPEFVVNGASRTFTAEAFDAFNNKISNVVVQWTVEGGVGTITALSDSSARFTATKEGAGRVAARSGDEVSSIDVTVTTAPATNVNATTNANKNANTNISTSNVNTGGGTAATNANDNINAGNVNAAETTTTPEPAACQPWPKPTWIWLFVGYLILLVVSLYPIRAARPTWWWVAPLVLTIAALWLYFQYRCYPVYPALPYLILLSGIIAASWYNWQRSSTQPKL